MTEQTERQVLEALWRLVHGRSPAGVVYDCGTFGSRPGHADRQKAERFTAMLDAEAYESAAIMLVPDDCRWMLDGHHNIARIARYWDDPNHGPQYEVSGGGGETPALALCAAIEAAMQAGEHDPA